MNKALLAVCSELEGRAGVEVVDGCVARTEALATAFSAATLCARWLWKSGRTKAGGAVPWDVQVRLTAACCLPCCVFLCIHSFML